MARLVVVTFKIEPELLDQLDLTCERKGLTRSDLIRQLIIEYLEKEKQRRQKLKQALEREIRKNRI